MKKIVVLALCSILWSAVSVWADNMEPVEGSVVDGKPVSVFKNLNQVEPRTAIMSLPFAISKSGSYYLIDNLHGLANSNGIVIGTNNVKVDLNGFCLIGAPGSKNGIQCNGDLFNLSVKNGVIRGWDEYGVLASNTADSTYCDLKVYRSGLTGIVVGDNSLIERCGAYDNGWADTNWMEMGEYNNGFLIGWYCTVKDSKARDNWGNGFAVGEACQMSGCTASQNGFSGIRAWGDYCSIKDCLITYNWEDGITLWSHSRVQGNNCGQNSMVGIRILGEANRVEDNSLSWNGFRGIEVAWGGTYDTGGNLVVRNSASMNGGGGPMDNFWMESGTDYFGSMLDNNAMDTTTQGFQGDPWSNFILGGWGP